jgi:hypothetical protein
MQFWLAPYDGSVVNMTTRSVDPLTNIVDPALA